MRKEKSNLRTRSREGTNIQQTSDRARGKEKEGLVQAQCMHLCSPQRPGTGAAPESISPSFFMLVLIAGHTGLALTKVAWCLGSERMKKKKKKI